MTKVLEGSKAAEMMNPYAADRDSKSHLICWQGWRVVLPRRWDAVKLEGDFAAGYALFADAARPRVGVRWSTPSRRKFDAKPAVMAALREEVGELAAREAKAFEMPGEQWESAMVYVEPTPPGRDIFAGYSKVSARILQVAYHAASAGAPA